MHDNAPRGIFVTGTDTGVGKTYVAALIAMSLRNAGHRVGVYKPVASGCHGTDHCSVLQSDDALALWNASGRPGELDAVCPQRFAAPLAPHLAARAEDHRVDAELLRSGLQYWRDRSEIVVVEGAGGLLSPISDDDFVADLALEFGYPLAIVAANRIGVINQVLQTLLVAKTYRGGIPVTGIVLNDVEATGEDPSRESNYAELVRLCDAPVLAHIKYAVVGTEPDYDWAKWVGSSLRVNN
jgi:dethiobiotin synthetase